MAARSCNMKTKLHSKKNVKERSKWQYEKKDARPVRKNKKKNDGKIQENT